MEKIRIDGLSREEVTRSREKYGNNALETIHRDTFFKQLLRSLGDPIIKDFDWYETVGIAIAIFLASFISTLSEYGSEKAFDKLQQEASKTKAKVKRFEGIVTIPIEEIVVGDIILLEYGEKIPADGVLLEGNLTIDESSITGESKEIYKYPFKKGLNPKETN